MQRQFFERIWTSAHLRYVHCCQGFWEGSKLGRSDDICQGAFLHVLQDDGEVCPRLEGADIFHNVLVAQVLEEVNLPHDGLQVV